MYKIHVVIDLFFLVGALNALILIDFYLPYPPREVSSGMHVKLAKGAGTSNGTVTTQTSPFS